MNTNEIRKVLLSDPSTHTLLKDVYCRDRFVGSTIPQNRGQSFAVINLDNCNKQGSHWVVVEYNGKRCYYFDSYGLQPIYQDISMKLYSSNKQVIYNKYHLQSYDTNVCGYYCVVYCMLRAGGKHTFDKTMKLMNRQDLSLDKDTRDHVIHAATKPFLESSGIDLKNKIHIDIFPLMS